MFNNAIMGFHLPPYSLSDELGIMVRGSYCNDPGCVCVCVSLSISSSSSSCFYSLSPSFHCLLPFSLSSLCSVLLFPLSFITILVSLSFFMIMSYPLIVVSPPPLPSAFLYTFLYPLFTFPFFSSFLYPRLFTTPALSLVIMLFIYTSCLSLPLSLFS